MEGSGRLWKGMEGYRRGWTGVEGHGRRWCSSSVLRLRDDDAGGEGEEDGREHQYDERSRVGVIREQLLVRHLLTWRIHKVRVRVRVSCTTSSHLEDT